MAKKRYWLYWGRGAGVFFLIVYNAMLIISNLTSNFYNPPLSTIGILNLIATLFTIGFFSIAITKK